MTAESVLEPALRAERWPTLPLDEWKDTYETLQRWTQIVGKVRLVQLPWINHSWHVTLYVTSRGLTTLTIPYGTRSFEVDFDFIDHELLIRTSDGDVRSLLLRPRSVADFYHEFMNKLSELGFHISIYPRPNEVADATPFPEDEKHASYDANAATRFWRILCQATRTLTEFRARFLGKCSPVHFFWGSFDLAVTRFSGRKAPPHPGGVLNLPDWVVREAYSHEVCSAGFWPGDSRFPRPAFYCYAYPEPTGFSEAEIQPASAKYSQELREFVLPYDDIRQAESPDGMLLEFFESTYEATANLARWDRAALERRVDPRSAHENRQAF